MTPGIELQTRVYIARDPVDFRRQIDGLALEVQEVLALDSLSSQVFVFRNRRGDKIKLLYWHGNGFCLLYKGLEQGVFPWPEAEQSVLCCGLRELHWLLDGLPLASLQPRNSGCVAGGCSSLLRTPLPPSSSMHSRSTAMSAS